MSSIRLVAAYNYGQNSRQEIYWCKKELAAESSGGPESHTPTNRFNWHMMGLPNDLTVYWHQYPYSLGIVFCKLRALISEAATYVSVLTISAFTLERYLAICHPLHLYAMAGLTRASRIILALWVVAFVCASPFAVYSDISYRDYPPNSGNASLDSAFCALMASSPLLELSSIFFFFLPAIFILCLYVTMGCHFRSTRINKKTKGILQGQIHGETRQAKSRKAIIRMLVAVVIAFFVCWCPFHIQRLFYIYGNNLAQFHVINEHLFNVAGALYYVSATVNPILYNVMSARYRLAFKETLFCRKVSRRGSGFNQSRRETTMSSLTKVKASFCRDTRHGKIDFEKNDHGPFCIETKVDEEVIFCYPNDNKPMPNGDLDPIDHN
ncbi:neuropeptides capa receptor-like [Pieris rapae]|uniref:neuropeptides capa receptor-like n=1 Tax=Pieris rapae TaxID=64459 RepID=UPI001E2819FD|nr:neuropeptides capa receptor-like [Pieris rapae]